MEENDLYMLHYCVENDFYPDRVRELLAEGMDPNQYDGLGNTPLHTAAESSKHNIKIVRELINGGADVNLINSKGYTPLHYAALRRKRDMVKILLQSGADINAGTSSGKRALHYAINKYRPEFFRQTPVQELLFLYKPDLVTIKILLQDPNVDINAISRRGETPLMCAVVCKEILALETLLKSGADPNISNIYRRSPLHTVFAVRSPSLRIAYLLLRHGANVCSLNAGNETPIDFLINRIRDDHSLDLAEKFIKMLAFHNNISDNLKMIIERHPGLSQYLKDCSAEVEHMKNKVISHNLTVHDFFLECFNEDQFGNVFMDIYKPLVDILMTGCYSIYLHDILRRIEKFQLWRVLRYNLILQNKAEDFRDVQKMEILRDYIKCVLSNSISHFDLFQLIMSCSDLTDIQIRNINSFRF